MNIVAITTQLGHDSTSTAADATAEMQVEAEPVGTRLCALARADDVNAQPDGLEELEVLFWTTTLYDNKDDREKEKRGFVLQTQEEFDYVNLHLANKGHKSSSKSDLARQNSFASLLFLGQHFEMCVCV